MFKDFSNNCSDNHNLSSISRSKFIIPLVIPEAYATSIIILANYCARKRRHYAIATLHIAIITTRRRWNLKHNTAMSDVAEEVCASLRALCALRSP